jgi:hypothetical protein
LQGVRGYVVCAERRESLMCCVCEAANNSLCAACTCMGASTQPPPTLPS